MKTLFLSFNLLCAVLLSNAQTWTKYGTGFSKADNVQVADLCFGADTSAWGILTLFSSGSCGGITPYFVKTEDGKKWTGGSIPLPTTNTPHCISATSKKNAWVATFDPSDRSKGMIFATKDGGLTWTNQSSANSADAARFVHFFNDNEGVAVGDSSIFVTKDGGVNWISKGYLPGTFPDNEFLFNTYEVVGNTIWLGDVYGNFYKSTDKGYSWKNIYKGSYPFRSVKGIAFRDSLYGIALASYAITGGSGGAGGSADESYYTTDGGISWTLLSPVFDKTGATFLLGAAKYDIAYIKGTKNSFVMTSEYGTSGAGHFSALSTDGGKNWKIIDSAEQHTACAFFDSTIGYTGGYLKSSVEGIYKWNKKTQTTDIADLPYTHETENPFNCFADNNSLHITNKQNLTTNTIAVFDLQGRKVMSSTKTNNNTTILLPISELPSALYIVKIYCEGTIYTSKFIKQ